MTFLVTQSRCLVCSVPEAHACFARCLAEVLLGVAQYVFAHHAQRKQSAVTLTSALFLGSSELFESASAAIKAADDAGLPVPGESFRFATGNSQPWIVRAGAAAVITPPFLCECSRFSSHGARDLLVQDLHFFRFNEGGCLWI
jgi:hypothetical protein